MDVSTRLNDTTMMFLPNIDGRVISDLDSTRLGVDAVLQMITCIEPFTFIILFWLMDVEQL
jgi:hypothetical protein